MPNPPPAPPPVPEVPKGPHIAKLVIRFMFARVLCLPRLSTPGPALPGRCTGAPGHLCRRLLRNLFPKLSTGKVPEPRSSTARALEGGFGCAGQEPESIPARMHLTLLPPASCSTQHSLCNAGKKKHLILCLSLPGCQKSALIDKKCADYSVSRRGSTLHRFGSVPFFIGSLRIAYPVLTRNGANWKHWVFRGARRSYTERSGGRKEGLSP